MIFWTRVKQAINNLWYPRSVTVGKPVETQELANRIARESTVSPADTHAVLRALPNIMAGFMKESDFLRHQHSRHLHPLQQMRVRTQRAFFLARLELSPARHAFLVGYDRSVPRLLQSTCIFDVAKR